jgi:hypothetical protein
MPHLDTEKSYSRKLESVHTNNGSHKLFHINFLWGFTAYSICIVVLHERLLWHDKHIRNTEQHGLKLCWGLLSCNRECLLILSADNHNHFYFIKFVMTYLHNTGHPMLGTNFYGAQTCSLWNKSLFQLWEQAGTTIDENIHHETNILPHAL